MGVGDRSGRAQQEVQGHQHCESAHAHPQSGQEVVAVAAGECMLRRCFEWLIV